MSAYFVEYNDPYVSQFEDESRPLIEQDDAFDETDNFPVGCLPPILAAMVKNVANVVQVDSSMAASIGLATIASCVSTGKIRLTSQDSESPLTLFTLVIAAPSEGKSPALAPFLKPIYDIQIELLRAYKLKQSDEKAQMRLLDQRIQISEKKAVTGDRNALADNLQAYRERAAFIESPTPRMVYDDVTPEGLVEKMSGTGRAFIASAEGGIFQTIGGRYANGIPNLDAILKSYDGESLSVDRKGADPLVIMRPLLTMALMVQQHTWEQLKSNADFLGRGFLYRFLVVEPKSNVGNRCFRGKKSNAKAVANYNSLIAELVSTFDQDECQLIMSPEADDVLTAYSDTSEANLRPDRRFGGSSSHIEWGGKLFGKTLRLCGILHCAQNGNQALETPISKMTAENAVVLAEWFANEWLRLMPLVPVRETLAQGIVEWLRVEGKNECSLTEVTRKFRNRAKAKDLHEALALLVEKGLLFSERSTDGFGRPPQNYSRNF